MTNTNRNITYNRAKSATPTDSLLAALNIPFDWDTLNTTVLTLLKSFHKNTPTNKYHNEIRKHIHHYTQKNTKITSIITVSPLINSFVEIAIMYKGSLLGTLLYNISTIPNNNTTIGDIQW